MLHRKGDQPVEQRQARRRVGQRRDDGHRLDVGRHRLGAPAGRAPDEREAARLDAIDHDPLVIERLGDDPIAGRENGARERLAQRRQHGFDFAVGNDPRRIATDRDDDAPGGLAAASCEPAL